jgi:hypothetical protein
MNGAEIKELLKKKHKYGAVRCGGFHSKLEAYVHQILLFREKAKEIMDIRFQQTVHLTRADIHWACDFSFIVVKTGEKMFCEAKGAEDARFSIIKKLYRFYGKDPLEIWKGHWSSPYLDEIIIPKIEESK